MNKAMNSDFQMNMVSGADYRVKLGTLMAGNDLPDLMHMFFGIGAAANLPDFFKAKMQDLTPYLSGDNIKNYPNLAAIPTYAWNNSDCAIDGQLFQWPIHRYLPGLSYFFKNTDVWDAKIGKDVVPKDATDLKKIMTQLNDPKGGQWAIGNVGAFPFSFGMPGYAMMFGAPNLWGLDSSGQFVKDIETPEYKAAVAYTADLWKSGLIWPDAPSSKDSRTNFVAKKFAMSVEGFGNSWNDFWLRGLTQASPPSHFDIIMPLAADSKTKLQGYITGGYISTNVMKKASPDRVRELLRIVDWLAPPFGSQEDMLLSYGLTPADYAVDSNGDPQLTASGKNRSQYVPWQYISAHPYVEYYPGIPNYAGHLFPIEKELVDPKIAVADATLGYYAPSAYSGTGVPATLSFFDGVTQIILGHQSISTYDSLVSTW
ncbi:MAG: hypothetical protein ACRDF8_11590, partial [Chloroflexota bacterium]